MRRKPASVIAICLWLGACIGTLPPSLHREIADEHSKMQGTVQEIQRGQQTVDREVQGDPDLFRNAAAPAIWAASFARARETLRTAEEVDRELAQLAGRNRADSRAEAERLLSRERALRETASGEARQATAQAAKWVTFRQDLPRNLDGMKQAYESVRATDLTALSKTVEKAEQDWPEKKDALSGRLTAVLDVPKSAESEWEATAALRQEASNGQISEPQLATLIEASDSLEKDQSNISSQADELRALSGQLYNSWDKILIDLDEPDHAGDQQYRERIRTVSTHITDAASKQSETSSSEQWVDVSEPQFHAVKNDVGMAIAHKSAGTFDSEAITTPEPAGFAYIAPESQGSNQYGYWNHDGGATVWTWLPQYLLLRELLWNHAYRPVVLDDYRGYRSAVQVGRTYYGQITPASLPRYGTHGTFTRTTYASSRYVQSGGFGQSAYASHNSGSRPSVFGSEHAEQHASPDWGDKSAGHRFGSGAGPSSGRRFGQSGGAKSFGRSFGRRR
ncbi:MAG: hypothetical protein JO210_01670 [Acidobacteriaceae bacterium]|nr:hypothetical protein [Acidobacteriaceae bacterium]